MPQTNLTFIARALSTRLVQLQGYGPCPAPRSLRAAILGLQGVLILLRRIEAMEEQDKTVVNGPLAPKEN
jgi:hypothetical protein